jgi:O-antigen/teichoic acid export membrane protein
MQFGKVAIVGVSSTSVQVFVTIATAWAGESYLSMAWGSIAGTISNVIILSLLRPEYALLTPTRHGLREVLNFGSKSSVTSTVAELGASGPDLIFGRTLGFDAVAYFSRAMSLNNMVFSKFTSVIRQVYFPAFAKGVREGHNVASLYYQSTALVVGLAAPLIVVLAIVADIMILLLFGSQWQRSANLAVVLCAFELIRTPIILAAPSLTACGHIGTVMRANILIQGGVLLLLSLSIWFQLEYVVYSLILARLIETFLFLLALHRHFGINLPRLWVHIQSSYLLVPFAAVGPALLRVSGSYTQIDLFPLLFLASSGALAVSGLVLGVFLLKHPLREEIYRLLPLLSRKT